MRCSDRHIERQLRELRNAVARQVTASQAVLPKGAPGAMYAKEPRACM